MNIPLINRNRFFLAICGLYFLVFAFISLTAQGMDSVTKYQRMILEKHGYSTNTPEQLIEATKSERYSVRFMALNLLTELIGEEAIPVLKDAWHKVYSSPYWTDGSETR